MRSAMMSGTLTEDTSDMIYSFLKCVNIFENSDLKYKSIMSLFHLLNALISSHEMLIAMMEIIVSLRRKWSEKSIELRSVSRRAFLIILMRWSREKESKIFVKSEALGLAEKRLKRMHSTMTEYVDDPFIATMSEMRTPLRK